MKKLIFAIVFFPLWVSAQLTTIGIESSIGFYHIPRGIDYKLYKNSKYQNYSFQRIPRMLSFYLQNEKNEFYLTTDIEQISKNLIWGIQSGYKHHFLRQYKLSHLYSDINWGFIRYGTGTSLKVPYNFKKNCEGFYDCHDHLERNNIMSFIGLIGYQIYLAKNIHSYVSFGTGINYHKMEPNVNDYPFRFGKRSQFSVIYASKIGIKINLYRL